MSQAQPVAENLSYQIARLRQALAVNDVLMPGTVAELVEFNRRFLADLHRFAADYETARAHSPGPLALRLAAAAAVRFYFRLQAPAAPLTAPPPARAFTGGPVVRLDDFRRPR